MTLFAQFSFRRMCFYLSLMVVALTVTGKSIAQNTGNTTRDTANDIIDMEEVQSQLETVSDVEIKEDTTHIRDTSWVIVGRDTLWPIYENVGAASVKDRAKTTSNFIQNLLFLEKEYVDSIELAKSKGSIVLLAHGDPIAYVFPEDAISADTTMVGLAIKYRNIIQSAASPKGVLITMEDLGMRLLKLLGVIVLLILVIKLINWLYHLVERKLYSLVNKRINGVKFKDIELISPFQEYKYLLFFLKLLRAAIILFQVYLSLPAAFSLFPWTEQLAHKLIYFIVDPLITFFWSFVDYIPNLISIIIIIYLGRGLVKFLRYIAEEIENGKLRLKGFYPEWSKPTFNLAKIAIYAMLLIFIFPFLPGSDSPIFKGVSVFIGVLFTMGSSTAVANAVAGLVLIYMRPYNVGDMVELEGVQGVVMEKSILVTRIKTPKQEIVTIPNAKILAAKSVNYSASLEKGKSLIISVTVTIGYDVPWPKVHEILLEAARNTQGVLESPGPFVLQTALNDFYVAYEINVHVEKVRSMRLIKSNLNTQIQESFRNAEVEILSPHYQANRDGNVSTIPEQYTPKEPIKTGEAKKNSGSENKDKPVNKDEKGTKKE